MRNFNKDIAIELANQAKTSKVVGTNSKRRYVVETVMVPMRVVVVDGEKENKFLILEPTMDGFGAFCPDKPKERVSASLRGCVNPKKNTAFFFAT